MRERNAIDRVPAVVDPERLPDQEIEGSHGKKLADGQFSHRQNKLRFQQRKFSFEPARTCGNFLTIRNSIAATFLLARETTTNRSEIHPIPCFLLRPTQRLAKPLEKSASGSPSEGAAEFRLLVARRLTDKNNLSAHRATDDGRAIHAGADSARLDPRKMLFYLWRRQLHSLYQGAIASVEITK